MFKSYLWCTGGKAIVGEKLNRKKVASFVENARGACTSRSQVWDHITHSTPGFGK